ncbi:MAG: hypothetical protein JST04_16190 [Bdellovibrionales bacterium]|nr:hypothetical protein [Bdellovibrionales bacterium]
MASILRVLGIALGVLLSGVPARAAERLPPVHLVFDLDWTLFSIIPEGADLAAYAGDARFFTVEGKNYRLSNGVAEAINRLLDFNRRVGYEYVKISFFSGGTRSRNEALLKKIVFDPDTGRTAFDAAEKVLSFEDLKDLFPDLTADRHVSFTDRYRKNLVSYFKDLERTVAVDDVEKFFVGDQSKSLLWIGETYQDFPTFADAVVAKSLAPPGTKYLPPDFAAWAADQNRILIAALELEYALDSEVAAANRPGRKPLAFRDRLQAIHARFRKDELLARLKKIYPHLSFFGCGALFRGPGKTPR